MIHGLNEITLDRTAVIFRAKGAFNMDGVKVYEGKFVQLVSPLMGKPWGIVNLYPDFETGGPEVVDRIRSQYKWCIANGCQYIGFHRTNVLHDFFAKKTTENLGLTEVAMFNGEKEVLDWIHEKLA